MNILWENHPNCEASVIFDINDIANIKHGLILYCNSIDSSDMLPIRNAKVFKYVYNNDDIQWMCSSHRIYHTDTIRFIEKLIQRAKQII